MWRVSALDREGREIGHFELASGELTIGRDTDRQLILPSASVSRRHARVMVDGGQVTIVDDGSSNGVSVDGVRIGSPTLIGPTNRIDLAEFRIVIAPAGGAAAAPSAMPGDLMRLIADGGPYDGRFFDVPAASATVGRALENELVFDDPSLSRKHARLTREGPGRLAVEDLGSSNGTFVNGRKVGKGTAEVGDTIQFGDLLFHIEGSGDPSGTRAVDTSGMGLMPLYVGAGVTAVVLLGALIALVHKVPPVQASGKEAIARITRLADQHLKTGHSLYRDKKYSEAKSEFDAAIDLDPANVEAHKLSRLAAHGPDDDRALAAAAPSLKIADRKGLEQTLRILDDLTDGSPQRVQLQGKLATALDAFGTERCGKRQWNDCGWALCREFDVAPAEGRPDPRAGRTLDDAEKHLQRDKTYVRCRAAH